MEYDKNKGRLVELKACNCYMIYAIIQYIKVSDVLILIQGIFALLDSMDKYSSGLELKECTCLFYLM